MSDPKYYKPKRNLRLVFIGIAFLALAGYTFYTTQTEPLPNDLKIAQSIDYNQFPDERLAVNQFIASHFLTMGLVRTNLQETVQSELATGQDLLSESVGLLLLYYVESDQEAAFEAQLLLAEVKLKKENGLYQWRTRDGQAQTVNASVDDLRIAKALILGSQKWDRQDFKNRADQLSQALLKACVKQDHLLSYDSADAPQAPLFYYDFKAMFLLAKDQPQWLEVLASALKQTQNAALKNGPYYDASGDQKSAYKMTENALIVLHLAEVGLARPSDLSWFKKQLSAGALLATYKADGTPLSDIESPAIYGILAQIGKNAADESLYRLAADKLKAMQRLAPGPAYGGYLSPDLKQGYSFDHLMALLGY